MRETLRISRTLRFYPVVRQVSVRQEREAGFSLIELMVVIGIMAIITAIALPAYSSWRERTAARNAADGLMAHLKQARIMAVSDNRCVEVHFDVAAPYGYTVDAGPNPRKPLNVLLSQYSKTLTMTTTIAAANKAMVFRSNGTAGTDTCASFSAALGSVSVASPAGSSHTITLNGIGRVYQ